VREIQRHWTLLEVLTAHERLDVRAELEYEAREIARQRAEGRRR